MKFSESQTHTADKNIFSTIISALLIAASITCISIILTAILLTYTGLSEQSLPIIITLTCVVAALVAGFDVSRSVDQKGWMWGMIAGGIYALLIILLEFWLTKSVSFDLRTLTMIILSLTSGALGGIVGINVKK